MYAIAICDDNANILCFISNYVQHFFEDAEQEIRIDLYTESIGLVDALERGCIYDILFLDIQMPKINGIELGKKLRTTNMDAFLIYISNIEEYVFETFQNAPFRFVRKRYLEADLRSTLEDLMKSLDSDKSNFIILNIHSKIYKIEPGKLVYVESRDKMLELVTQSHATRIRYRMGDMEALLAPHGFLRIHKGYIVNYRYIFSIEREAVILDNRVELPISRHRYAAIMRDFSALMMQGE